MSLYHIVFLILLLGVLWEYLKGSTPKAYYGASFLILTLMLALRFGQGTDYYSYHSIYTTMPMTLSELKTYAFSNVEWGWRLLTVFFKAIGFSFFQFVCVLSLFQMAMLWRFVSRNCRNKMFALFLCYHTLYLTYFSSALRQGMVISIFIGILLEWLQQGKYFRYCVLAILCGSIHSVGFVLLIPVVFKCIHLKFSHLICLVAIGFSFGIVFSVVGVGQILKLLGIGGSAVAYMGETDISIIALAERAISYVLISYIYYIYCNGEEPQQNDKLMVLFKIYSLSVVLYALLLWSPLISSRTTYLFKIMEIALFSTCVMKCGKVKNLVICYCLLLCTVLYYKNIGSYISQGYYTDCSTINFPYVSVFNKNDIAPYRMDTGRYIQWLDLEFEPEYVGQLQEIYQTNVANVE